MHVVGRLHRWTAATCELLFPPCCALCGDLLPESEPEHRVPVCPECLAGCLQAQPACPHCAAPVKGNAQTAPGCARCRHRRYHFQAALALGPYRGALREAVLKMKQVLHEPLTLAMGRVLAEHVQGRLEKVPDLVVPIPIHWLRRLVRGTNTSEVLVEPVCHRLQVPGALDLLHFRRKVKKQGTLLSGERFRNMRGAFGLSSGYDIREADILLIDDVMTTGATVSEAARVLRKAGAARVTVAVVARGVGPS